MTDKRPISSSLPGGANVPGQNNSNILIALQNQNLANIKKATEGELININKELVSENLNIENSQDINNELDILGVKTILNNGVMGQTGSTYKYCITAAGPIGATGIYTETIPEGCTCSPPPKGSTGYCCECTTTPNNSPEIQLKNLSQVNDYLNYFNNITTNIASIKVYQEEMVYFNRKIKPLLDTVNSLSFALQNAAVSTQIIQSIPFSHKSQIKETLDLSSELVCETRCMVDVLKKRLSIFRGMALKDIEEVGCLEKTAFRSNRCNLDDC